MSSPAIKPDDSSHSMKVTGIEADKKKDVASPHKEKLFQK